MKIAILSCFYPYRGGISQFNACIYGELSKSHTVKAFNFKRQYPSFLFPGRTQYVTEEDNAVPVESEALLDTANPFSYHHTAKKIREWGPDLLLLRYWNSYFAPSFGYVARHMDKKCRVISILDNVIPHERHFYDKMLTRYFLRRQSGYIVLCDAVRDDLLSFMPEARYLNTPHPLYSHFGEKRDRLESETELKIPHGKKNLLFFGLIREYKGLDILIEAFSGLDKSYNLIIAGEPYGSFEKYRKLIEESPNRENIFVNTEYIPDNRVSLYFSAADLCVLPYRSATQSGIGAISTYYGVPMVTTNVGGLKEMFETNGTGIVVDRIESSAIREAVETFFDTGNREKFRENIKKEKERLSWSNFCSKLTDFAESLQNNKN